MKYNLKNFLLEVCKENVMVPVDYEVEKWFEGFKKELKEIKERKISWTRGMWPDKSQQMLIETILGERE